MIGTHFGVSFNLALRDPQHTLDGTAMTIILHTPTIRGLLKLQGDFGGVQFT